ncbi:MAG: hypothetical protein R3A52_28460 [Polyangiales bacterium]
MRKKVAALALALASVAPSTAAAQRLRRASEAARTGRSDRPRDEPRRSSSSEPRATSSRGSGRGSRWSLRRRAFLPFPYAWGGAGYAAPVAPPGESARGLAVVASLDGGYVFDAILRGGAGLRLMTSSLEFELRYSAYNERDGDDSLWVALGRYRVGVAIVDVARARARVFAGMIHWVDAEGSLFGGEAGVGADLFVGAPFVLSLDLSVGGYGRAVLAGGKLTLGVMAGPVEFQLGWQHESIIPTVSGPPVNLTGPLLGLRLWR